ncbi:hypothetical protein [Bdellovibrio sp. HCB2-146]|uniref:hypothetical protein n=1 Tax=Bdellovibrio sp. HCB2-146 TaxID=3394362 RepID=UPI0039BC5E6F
MKLSRLMEQHQKFKDQGLKESFGDGYLMVHNRVYKNVRLAAIDAGYRFSHERNEAYETFPLLQLDKLLQTKVLPYSQNVVAFESMTAKELDILTWDDLDGNLKKNFVFHEATHAVVRSLAEKFLPSQKLEGSVEGQRLFALRMLLEESCANTCELMGVLDTGDAIHKSFYELNSYVCEFENRTHLKNAVEEFGSKTVFHWMILSYLHANFLRERISDSEFSGMLRAVGLETADAKKLKNLRGISKIAFNLSERFRYQTTDFHLRLAGVNIPTEDLFDFDFLAVLISIKGIESFFKELMKLAP